MENYKVPSCPLARGWGDEGPTVWDKPWTWTSCPRPPLVQRSHPVKAASEVLPVPPGRQCLPPAPRGPPKGTSGCEPFASKMKAGAEVCSLVCLHISSAGNACLLTPAWGHAQALETGLPRTRVGDQEPRAPPPNPASSPWRGRDLVRGWSKRVAPGTFTKKAAAGRRRSRV